MISRSAAPPAVKRTGRRLSRTWGRLSARARLQPSFLIVGAQRCGTTSLFRALAAHPAVVPPLFHKGVHYFDVNYQRGSAWYQGHFPVRALARRRTATAGCEPVTGESSPFYMHHPLAPARIAGELPQVKLIVLLRDPVERAWSAHKHESARGFEDQPFERALELEDTRLAGEAERMAADPCYQSHAYRHQGYLARGRYAEQLRELYRHVDSEHVLVLDSDAFFADGRSEYARALEFLGLPAWTPDSFEQHNARPSAPMSESTHDRLRAYFDPHDEELTQLLGSKPSWRSR